MDKELIFALDIGTRNVVGIVGEKTGSSITVLACHRQEHPTRSMLDGQIHSVLEVAQTISLVKERLEGSCGSLSKVAVAAAGRALITIHSVAEFNTSFKHMLAKEDEKALELAAIQNAQKKLADSRSWSDPLSYYCVGYSIVHFALDGTILHSLIGQRGLTASIEIIVTFLPRQVIDSIQSVLESANLSMTSLTLEPIAAINVLIPPTMRHLNLVLVDVGAGTSDIAITKDGCVVAYGMVPCAGDEITEALSAHYLLDFTIAEKIKRQLSDKTKRLSFVDILGQTHKVATADLIASLTTCVSDLSQAIAKEILKLNIDAPQAVLLVGGGSQTPLLTKFLAQALNLPLDRVAIKHPENILGINNLLTNLITPDAVTPLGILKIAGSPALNFIHITLNDHQLRLFNLGNLKISDALLSMGLSAKSIYARPGLGITITVDCKTLFLPGSSGSDGSFLLNGNPASLDDILQDGDIIIARPATHGTSPAPTVAKVATIPLPLTVTVNNNAYSILPVVRVNGDLASMETILKDRDIVSCDLPLTLQELLSNIDMLLLPDKRTYSINDKIRIVIIEPKATVNDLTADLNTRIKSGDIIRYDFELAPTIAEILDVDQLKSDTTEVFYNGAPLKLPGRYSILADDNPIDLTFIPPNNCCIRYKERTADFNVSEILLLAGFNPTQIPPQSTVTILVNDQTADFTAIVNQHDKIDVCFNPL